LHRARWLLRLMVALAWVPLVLNTAGWVYREESRQPWFIVNEVLVRDAVSVTNPTGVVVTGTLFIIIGLAAALLAWRLMYASMARPTTPRLGIAPARNTDESEDHGEMVLS
jgi:cytochrome bd-type quinol oxidase subunit 1